MGYPCRACQVFGANKNYSKVKIKTNCIFLNTKLRTEKYNICKSLFWIPVFLFIMSNSSGANLSKTGKKENGEKREGNFEEIKYTRSMKLL